MNRIKKIIVVALCLVLILPGAAKAETLDSEDIKLLEDTLNIIEEAYPFKYDRQKIMDNAIKGIINSIDEFSYYYSEEERKLMEGLDRTSGIGVVLMNDEGRSIVKSIMRDTPAEKCGLRPGDVIKTIDGVEVKGKDLTEVMDLIRGEKKSRLTLEVKRDKEIVSYDLVRELIVGQKIRYKNIGDILYIKLPRFSIGASDSVGTILKGNPSKKIILDLRDNPGGYVQEAIGLADLLLPEGELTTLKYKKTSKTISAGKVKDPYELVVLINEDSASASELFAGAVKDRNLGLVVGNTSFGKGTVQSLKEYGRGGLLKLTVGEYLPPSKAKIHKVGVVPNEVVLNKFEDGKLIDQQYNRAVKLLSK